MTITPRKMLFLGAILFILAAIFIAPGRALGLDTDGDGVSDP